MRSLDRALNASSTPSQELLERLRDVVHRNVPLPCMQLRAKQAYLLSSVEFDGALLAMPLYGRKRVRTADRCLDILPGTLLLIPNACTLDIENIPDAHGAGYVAMAISLEEHVLGAVRSLLRNPVSNVRGAATAISMDDCLGDLTTWLNALQSNEKPLACHAMAGLLLKLYAQGHHGLMYSAPPTLAARLRAMVAADPSRDWSSAEVEAHLAMSGASVRRHLAAEGASLREIITDARLSHALSLLTSTRLPVKVVAQRVGYSSVSGFSRRFSERYGVDPSRVGSD